MSFMKRTALIGIALILLSTSAMPAMAATNAPLTIENRTETTVTLILRGPTDKDVVVNRYNMEISLVIGFYDYRYYACGRLRHGSFTLGGGGYTLRLRKCEKGIMSTISLINRTGHTFALDLFGATHYALTVKEGLTKLKLVAGVYQYSTNACGFPVQRGTIKLKSGDNEDWVFFCNDE